MARGISIQSSTASDLVASGLGVLDGTRNRRAQFFLDDASGTFGIRGTASSGGVGDFVISTSFDSERFRITNTGNVGIGVTSPAANAVRFLQIGGASTSELHLTTTGSTDVTNRGLSLQLWSDSIAYLWNRESGAMSFGTNNTEKMRIDASGNVGIGTTNPTAGFHVHNATTHRYLASQRMPAQMLR